MPSVSKPLLDLLETGELLLAPSDLAARRIRRSFDQAQQNAGVRVWQPALALSWGQWLQSLWSECLVSGVEGRLLLNSYQERQLWREIIAAANDSQTDDTLASTSSLATLASQAWRLAVSYGAVHQLRSSAATHDARTFATWAEQFNQACQRNGYTSQAELEGVLSKHVASHAAALPPRLHLLGFLDFTPSQHNLLQAVRDAGTSVELHANDSSQTRDLSLIYAADEDEELRAAAAWIRGFLETNARADIPASVAVVVPDLEGQRESLNTVFREVLAPELALVGSDISAAPYEFTSGDPLSAQPMIAVALDIARWIAGPLPLNAIGALLLSPYLCKPEHLEESAQFDACELRQAKLLRPEISIAWLLRLAERSRFGAGPLTWLRPLQASLPKSANLQTPRTFAEWSEFIRRLLRSAGWPGIPYSNCELELARAWDHALDTTATLDFSGNRVPYGEALQALEHIAASVAFPLTTVRAPVQIMRPSDLAGMTFDALLAVRMTDDNWPPQERANPLIDWRLQASLRMPGTDSARADERYRLEMKAILTSALKVVFSYAANSRESKQRLSPLVAGLPLHTYSASELLTSVPAAAYIEPESVPDNAALPALPPGRIHGGASVLQHQAACGFRAFAEVRLRALALEERDTGLDPRQLGDLLHRTLNLFWSEIRTRAKLSDMPSNERRLHLVRCIDASFDDKLRAEADWDRAYIAVQKERLCNLLMDWLKYELERGPFEVLSTESQQMLTVGPLDLNVRVDRLDRLPQVSEDAVLLVDYKTGYSAKPQDWLGERPDEPQLPLYALLPESGTLAGLTFAKVRAGDSMGWLGYAAEANILHSKNAVQDIAAHMEEWKANLTALAEDFAAGDARVRPKEYPVTCTYCAQRMLCRLDAASLLEASDSDEYSQEESSVG